MLFATGRRAARLAIATKWPRYGGVRAATSLSSALKISSIPAPHAGSISVLSLNRPSARNAISKQLLSELNGVVEGLHAEGVKGSTRALILASESDQSGRGRCAVRSHLGVVVVECPGCRRPPAVAPPKGVAEVPPDLLARVVLRGNCTVL